MKFIKEKFKHLNTDIVIYVLFGIISIFYLVTKITNKGFSTLSMLLITAVFTLIVVCGYFLFKKMFTKKIRLERFFLLFAALFGSLYLFGFPPSEIPDEQTDYLRTLEISRFHLIAKQSKKGVGEELPTNIEKVYSIENYSDVIKKKDLKLNKETKFYDYSNKALYSFVCYIPQATGIFIAKSIGLSIVWQIIFGKIFNYILYVTLIYFAIKYIPFKKELIFFLALLPISLQEAISLSPDSMIICTLFALASFILYQRNNNKAKMNTKNKILLFVLSILISLCKIVYLPLIFLIFLIPDNKFKSKKEKWIYCGLVCFVSAILNLCWLSISSGYLSTYQGRGTRNPSLQLKYILSHPIHYCIIIFRTIDNYITRYLEEMVGAYLGVFKIGTSRLIVLLSIVVLFLLVGRNEKKRKEIFNNMEKFYIVLIIVGTILLMYTSLYIQWTGYKALMVEGIQGRYYLPMIPFIAMLFMKEKENMNNKRLIYFVWFMDIMSVVAIYNVFI